MDRVGFIGLGTMGAAMAANIRRAGFPLVVWNRTPGRAGSLVELGAEEASTPADVASRVDVVVTCVTDTPDLAEVLLQDEGVMRGSPLPSVVVDCSTVSPIATKAFGAELAEHEVALVDAPVSGGSEGAQKGTLTIFVGGEPGPVERVRPVLSAMGSTVTHLGPIGSGQAAKAVNQVIIAGTYLGVAEGIVLAMRSGLDLEALTAALAGGSARSWVLENRSARMIEDDYPLGFRVSLHRKDLGIALEMARDEGVTLPVAALAAQFENGLVAQGHGDEDVSALARVIRKGSGL
jgi:3-hydroxyisobutyrate dehydrogenase